jgi:hypothetical protein
MTFLYPLVGVEAKAVHQPTIHVDVAVVVEVVAAAANFISYLNKNRLAGTSLFFILTQSSFNKSFYRPRMSEIRAPNNPITPKITIISPIGIPIFTGLVTGGSKVGIIKAGGAVKVGSLVGADSTMN